MKEESFNSERFDRPRKYRRGNWRNMPVFENSFIVWLLIVASATSFAVAGQDYWLKRVSGPAVGGSITEGIVGSPSALNPILTGTNEAEHDINELIFSGLTKNDDNGKITGDLAEKIETTSRGREYTFTLKENIYWSDGRPITVEDVVFTIETIQDPEYRSPLRPSWQGILLEKIDDRTVKFTVSTPFVSFLDNATQPIIPKHIWQEIPPEEFSSFELNENSVVSGPYKIEKIKKEKTGKIKSIKMGVNKNYYSNVYVKNITLKFYPSEETVFNAYERGDVSSVSLYVPDQKNKAEAKGGSVYSIRMPRYFGVFFNQEKNDILKERSVRQSLSQATDKDGLVNKIFKEEASTQNGPLPPWYFSPDSSFLYYEFDPEKSRESLQTLEIEEEAALTLTTADVPELTEVAKELKKSWEDIGFLVNLDIVPTESIQKEVIRPRNYEALLFGEALGLSLDPFAFWHSTQVEDPGLNLSLYKNKEVDAILESARQELDEEERKDLYKELEYNITEDIPAIFIYSPNYLYVIPSKVKNFSKKIIGRPSHRFENIEDWHIKTKRVYPENLK